MKSFYSFKSFVLFFLLICLNSFVKAQKQKPGDVSPNARSIDADNLRPFNLGAAVISKGSSTALIDKNGDFILPYNSNVSEFSNVFQDERTPSQSQVSTGLFVKHINFESVLINAKGQVISKKLLTLTSDGKYLWGAGTGRGSTLIVDFNNNQKNIPALNDVDARSYNCGLAPFNVKLSDNSYGKFGYKDINGKIIVPPQYSDANRFSNGMALVATVDQYGEIKYGYIDSLGKLVIPLIYSKKPTNFYGETAIVYPKGTNAGFDWALINKKGEIIQKYNRDQFFVPQTATYFHNMRYDERNHRLLGYNGKILTDDEFLAIMGIKAANPHDEKVELLNIDRADGKIYYMRTVYANMEQPITGFVDINTGKKMEGPFAKGFYFDKVSGLALAMCVIKKDRKTNPFRFLGYINEDGIFVIVKKAESAF